VDEIGVETFPTTSSLDGWCILNATFLQRETLLQKWLLLYSDF
jgi:hypothetical protein